jgi:hypothetical protein
MDKTINEGLIDRSTSLELSNIAEEGENELFSLLKKNCCGMHCADVCVRDWST